MPMLQSLQAGSVGILSVTSRKSLAPQAGAKDRQKAAGLRIRDLKKEMAEIGKVLFPCCVHSPSSMRAVTRLQALMCSRILHNSDLFLTEFAQDMTEFSCHAGLNEQDADAMFQPAEAPSFDEQVYTLYKVLRDMSRMRKHNILHGSGWHESQCSSGSLLSETSAAVKSKAAQDFPALGADPHLPESSAPRHGQQDALSLDEALHEDQQTAYHESAAEAVSSRLSAHHCARMSNVEGVSATLRM